jgi:DNA polymerase-3 subunit gamma/tau
MSLYHKYRPKGLRGIVGNTQVVASLKTMLNAPDLMPHSYLLSGPTGCGKTTIGRIIKNTLDVSDNDFIEINSSEMRGIDTVRDIIKNSQYKPLESDYRIYLIDECHKMTNDAQNAFLKPLEDTPKHIIFILCTTEPEKLIKAVLGRCQTFQLERLSEPQMETLLKRIIKKEGDELDEKVLSQIIETGEGHPRDSIQILEQVLNTAPENRLEAAKISSEEKSESYELCKALIADNSWKKIRPILVGLKGQDAEKIRRHVLGYAQAVLLRSENDKAGLIMEEFIEPFYHTGFPQLVYACYSVVKNS